MLAKQNIELHEVPVAGQRVVQSSTANLSLGGDSIEVTEELHPDIKDAAIRAAEALGIDYCGIDFLMNDHAKGLDEQTIGICEINSRASVIFTEYPVYGAPRGVAEKAFWSLVKKRELETLPAPLQEVTMQLKIRGRVTKVGYRKWFKKHADDLGIKGYVKNSSARLVVACVTGNPEMVSALCSLAIKGPSRAIVTSVKARRVEPESYPVSFEVVKNA